jgi:hypothetical protein
MWALLQRLGMIVRGNLYRAIGVNKKLYLKRYAHCAVCPSNSRNSKDLTDVETAWQFIGGEFCTECTCPLKSKLVESLSECPQLKWGQNLKPKTQCQKN